MNEVATHGGNAAAPEPRASAADRGLAWWTEAWALFMRNPLLWVALGVILLVGAIVIGMVPLLGGLAVSLLMPVLIGGWLLTARKVEHGGTLEVTDLFAGFQGDKLTPLIVLGALLLAAMVAIGLVAGVLGMGALWGMFAGGMHNSPAGVMAAMARGSGAAALPPWVATSFIRVSSDALSSCRLPMRRGWNRWLTAAL